VTLKKGSPKTTKQAKEVEVGRYSIPVVLSTFRILDELSKADGLGLNEVTQKTGVAKSTVFRVLATLLELGYVLRRNGKYSVTNKLATLANEMATSETIRRVALPFMLRLRDEFGETVNLGVLRLDKVEYIEVAPSESALRFSEKPGSSVQVHASALGKVLLAYAAPEVVNSLIGGRKLQMLTPNTITDPSQFIAEAQKARHRGYAFDRGETSPSATCVAAPILGGADTAIAALSISGPSSRFNPRKDSPVIERLQLAVAEISRQLQQRLDLAENAQNHVRPNAVAKRRTK
jgi:IclR family transcriptional regulator, acetate operon repressor